MMSGEMDSVWMPGAAFKRPLREDYIPGDEEMRDACLPRGLEQLFESCRSPRGKTTFRWPTQVKGIVGCAAADSVGHQWAPADCCGCGWQWWGEACLDTAVCLPMKTTTALWKIARTRGLIYNLTNNGLDDCSFLMYVIDDPVLW